MASNNLDFGEFVDFSVKKRFGIITLSRVERSNALTIKMLRSIKNAIEYCQNNEKIRGLILTGKGKSFTTGIDIAAVDGSDHDAVKDVETTAGQISYLLYNGKPAICAINGRAMGDGVVYALSCDYRITVKDSFFQMPEINSGIFPGAGCLVIMAKIIGVPWTKKMLMFAERINPDKALEIGLIDQIVDSQEDLMNEAFKRARLLFTKNQTVLNAIKISSNHLFDKSYNEAFALEKIGSGWFEHENKDKFISDFRKKFHINLS